MKTRHLGSDEKVTVLSQTWPNGTHFFYGWVVLLLYGASVFVSVWLDVVSVCQVGCCHSLQRQVGAGEPPRQRRLPADGRGRHEHPGQSEQGWLEVHTNTNTQITHHWRVNTCHGDWSLIRCIDRWQGAEGFGDRDGDVHRHVLSLPADQDHEEHPDTDRQVSAAAMTFDL